MQQTLILYKPDCVQRRLVGALTAKFEQKGLRLAGLKLIQASRTLAEQHYAVHKGKPFYDSLLSFLTSGPAVAIVFTPASRSTPVAGVSPTDRHFDLPSWSSAALKPFASLSAGPVPQ